MSAQIAEREELQSVTLDRRNAAGEVLGTVELDPEIFGRTPNVPLMHQVVTAQLAARRSGTQSTKTRAEVSGGGAKPYRQKGTGRARQGTIRAPQYTGGGIALGPKPRSYAQRTPRKMTRLALFSALSDRLAEGRVCLVDKWTFEVPKTKDAVAALGALGLEGNILLVISPEDILAERSFANLAEVDLIEGAQLSAYDVLVSDWIVFTDATLPGEATAVEDSATATAAKKAAADAPAKPAAEKAPAKKAARVAKKPAPVVATTDDEETDGSEETAVSAESEIALDDAIAGAEVAEAEAAENEAAEIDGETEEDSR